ncbi:hypothetical protein EHQ58_08120 [Leptospira ognonensis]|uniref:Uncharacterized protein n=1 Tax=Leptospira ognonensis TaxID=2484945 RepID=A0A4R9K392_9LEPT|nr:hypothetical protein [Leptospira ognonensis]TGL59701.1 hypothetical protein EHQ58_08120 [Leptospira ognonensis]
MKNLLFLLLIVSLHCAQAPKERTMEPEHVTKHREICEEDGEEIFESLFFEKSKETVQTKTGQVTSVVATGGTALTETLVYLGGGAVVGLLICSPMLAAEAASKSKSSQGASCVLEVGSKVSAALIAENGYEYTKRVWNETSQLRDYDFDELSSLVRENCQCYMKTGQKRDLETAWKQIREWKKENGIWEHLSGKEKEKVEGLEREIFMMIEKPGKISN